MANGEEPVQIGVLSSRACLRLKAWQAEPDAGGTPGAAAPVTFAGRELPTQAGSVLPGEPRVLCVGPGDWLIFSRERSASELQQRVESLLPAEGYSLVDLSDGLAGFEIQGSASRELLSKGCALDFHPRSFVPGQFARTRFAGIPVVIECLDGSPRFELMVARSYSQYLHAWLTDATIEFQSLRVEALPVGR